MSACPERCNTGDSSDVNFQEPHVGFTGMPSSSSLGSTSSALPPLESLDEARREFVERRRSRHIDSSTAKKILRQPINIYQKPFEQDEEFLPPRFEHDAQEEAIIQDALSRNFVFSDLTFKELSPLIAAFEKVVFQENAIIIRQGEPGDYFYIIMEGKVAFEVNETRVGQAGKGKSFGELALLYTCPRAATVTALGPTTLFRVDQKTFRFILQAQTKQSERDKIELLRNVDFMKQLAQGDVIKLTSVMTPRVFREEELLVRKGDPGDAFYVIEEGKVLVKDISVGSTTYKDQLLGPGEYFGERALITSEPRAANVVALTRGIAFTIDRETFESVLGKFSRLIMKAQDVRRLNGVPIFSQACLDSRQMANLASYVVDTTFIAGEVIVKKNVKSTAALYLVREGVVEVDGKRIGSGGYFGQQSLQEASSTSRVHIPSPISAICIHNCELGVLTMADCKNVFDTDVLMDATTADDSESDHYTSMDLDAPLVERELLRRIAVLGEGSFGQVWLVSEDPSDPRSRPFALKILSKKQLAREGQVKATIQERDIMKRLHHPFITRLIDSYHDERFVYLLVSFVQGGELFSLIHADDNEGGLDEMHARFYAFCISEALFYMHRKKIVYRDLKPENVLIDVSGYPVLIDFGFSKFVVDKTYTLCGTPGYLAPEVIMSRGHNYSADNWGVGILTYELCTGENPFFFQGMDQMAVFQSIVKEDPKIPDTLTAEARDIIQRLLVKDPSRRFGSLSGGEREIFNHPWFHGFDRNEIRNKRIPPPWIPDVDNHYDIGYFDDWSHLEDKLDANDEEALSDEQMRMFSAF